MLVAFFESIKYVGHLIPVSVLRIYFGYVFLLQAYSKLEGEYLIQPQLADSISANIANSSAADWYRNFLETVVVPHWQIFSYTIMYFQFLVGVSLILGFFVRPVSLVGALMALQFIYISPPEDFLLYQIQIFVFITFAWLGAGRCFGLDYFFFKRQRGIIW